MKTLLIQNDDIVIKNGNLMMIENIEECCQCVERALTTGLEEFFLNLEHGMDYTEFEQKASDIDRLKLDVTECILQEERVQTVEIIDIQIDRANRKANINFVAMLENNEDIQGSVVI